jgi:putative FmdB family regulatory protein
MPFYDFKCSKCNSKFDKLVRVGFDSKKDPIVCPKCGSKRTYRVVSVTSSFRSGDGGTSHAGGGGDCAPSG